MTNILPISNVRQELPELVNKVNTSIDKVIITVNGKPKAALISAELLESLEETAEVAAIPNIKEDLKRSQEQIKRGEFVSLDDL